MKTRLFFLIKRTCSSFIFAAFAICGNMYSLAINKTFLGPRPTQSYLPLTHTAYYWLIYDALRNEGRTGLQVVPYSRTSHNQSNLARYFLFAGRRSLHVGKHQHVDNQNLKFNEFSMDNLTGKLSLRPRSTTTGVYLSLYQQLSKYVCGLSYEIATSVDHITNSSGLRVENGTTSTTQDRTIQDYFEGHPMFVANNECECRNVQDPLDRAKIVDRISKTGIADINVKVNYNILANDRLFARLSGLLLIPTTRGAQSNVLFEPILGGAGHWAVGLGTDGKCTLWSRDRNYNKLCMRPKDVIERTHELQLVWEFNWRYFISHHERRILGLRNENGQALDWSQYMIFGDLLSPHVLPSANLLTQNVVVSPRNHFEGLIMFSYLYRGICLETGYNTWIKQKEGISRRDYWRSDRYGMPASEFGAKIVRVNPDDPDSFIFTKMTLEDTSIKNTIRKLTNPQSKADNGLINESQIDTSIASSPSTFTNTFFFGLNYAYANNRSINLIGFGVSYEWPFNNAALERLTFWFKGAVLF